ncbi:flagellar biosynthesis anti-sigma factor FlgM [Clostridium swellfunianum]|uniref:flagellar biosynthesis anti-sigma factor FlgM n=1 Tax=Clostridium swellfunianum TaxID=1367462 RepID=UPI00202EE13C|nr:flagellar biosynthesis anti-sigma factor FlgM [Clostridium swellfunianum]MCM0650468.1 flagellar biosynthesis anti-sigma factor FlgM [Clostridium swellfunianum]
MKINGASVNKVVNLYSFNKKLTEKTTVNTNKDTIEISSLGKSLSSYSVEEGFENSAEKIEKLKKEVSQGTYKADSKLVAKKMLDNIKGRGI